MKRERAAKEWPAGAFSALQGAHKSTHTGMHKKTPTTRLARWDGGTAISNPDIT